MSRNFTLDILKFVSSYMVVFIHYTFYGKLGVLVDASARFAVPIFFIMSGYFAYNNESMKIKKKIVHIVQLYLYGVILYFIWHSFKIGFASGIYGIINYIKSYFKIKPILYFFLFNLTKVSAHLWFLCALAYCYFIQYLIYKWKIKEKIVFMVSGCLLVVHILLGEGLSVCGIHISIMLVRNFFLMGYPFFAMGMLFKKEEIYLKNIFSYKSLMVLLFVGAVEVCISRYFFGKNELYIGSIFVAASLFICAIKLEDKYYNTTLVKISNTSTDIYIIHMIIGSIINSLSLRGHFGDTLWWKYINPIVICVISTLIALLMNMFADIIRRNLNRFSIRQNL